MAPVQPPAVAAWCAEHHAQRAAAARLAGRAGRHHRARARQARAVGRRGASARAQHAVAHPLPRLRAAGPRRQRLSALRGGGVAAAVQAAAVLRLDAGAVRPAAGQRRLHRPRCRPLHSAPQGHSALPHRPHRRCGRAADGEPAAAVHCAVRPHAPRAAVSRADAGPPARVPRVQQPQRRARLPLPGAEAVCRAPLGAAAAAAAAAASTCGTARVECSSGWRCCRRPAVPSARLGFGGCSLCCRSPSSARQAWHVQELAQNQVVPAHAERPAMRPCAPGRPSAAALFRVRQERLLLPPRQLPLPAHRGGGPAASAAACTGSCSRCRSTGTGTAAASGWRS